MPLPSASPCIISKFSRTTLKDLSYSTSSDQLLLLDRRVQLLPRIERGRRPEHGDAEQGLKSGLSIIDNRLQRNGVLELSILLKNFFVKLQRCTKLHL